MAQWSERNQSRRAGCSVPHARPGPQHGGALRSDRGGGEESRWGETVRTGSEVIRGLGTTRGFRGEQGVCSRRKRSPAEGAGSDAEAAPG